MKFFPGVVQFYSQRILPESGVGEADRLPGNLQMKSSALYAVIPHRGVHPARSRGKGPRK